MQNTNQADAPVRQSILVIFETPRHREQAVGACAHLSENARVEIDWCSLSELTTASYAEKMAEKAAATDLIIFSGNCEGDFSKETKLWLERWLFKRSAHEGTMVGLFTNRSAGFLGITSVKEMYLRQAAHHAGLDYLSHLPTGPRRTIPDSLDTFNRRAGQITSVLDEILRPRTHSAPPL